MAINAAQRRVSKFPTDVYRVYDADGDLLYVGCSVNALKRMHGHKQSAKWWNLAASGLILQYENRAMARVEEAAAILEEQPRFNVQIDYVPPVEVTEHLEALDLFWEDGRVWVDAA